MNIEGQKLAFKVNTFKQSPIQNAFDFQRKQVLFQIRNAL